MLLVGFCTTPLAHTLETNKKTKTKKTPKQPNSEPDVELPEADELEGSAVAQQGLLPSANDPKLWVCQCRPGRAREAALQLLQKAYALAGRGTPLAIKAVVALDHLSSHFYVEADKESHVRGVEGGALGLFLAVLL